MKDTEKKIQSCLIKLGVKKGMVLYLSGNIGMLGFHINKKFLNNFYKSIFKVIGKDGTIVFPTHSFYLLKKKKIFDLFKTKSETGIFSEFLRKKKSSFRQIHPYSSSSAIGKHANYICNNNDGHVYGPENPFDRMIKLKTKFISFGLKPNYACPQVHHAEYTMNVPYRKIMTYKHKIKIKHKIFYKEFYLFNLKEKYRNIKRSKNKKIFRNFKKKNKIREEKLGVSKIYAYSLNKFYNANIELLKKDIFCWLK